MLALSLDVAYLEVVPLLRGDATDNAYLVRKECICCSKTDSATK